MVPATAPISLLVATLTVQKEKEHYYHPVKNKTAGFHFRVMDEVTRFSLCDAFLITSPMPCAQSIRCMAGLYVHFICWIKLNKCITVFMFSFSCHFKWKIFTTPVHLCSWNDLPFSLTSKNLCWLGVHRVYRLTLQYCRTTYTLYAECMSVLLMCIVLKTCVLFIPSDARGWKRWKPTLGYFVLSGLRLFRRVRHATVCPRPGGVTGACGFIVAHLYGSDKNRWGDEGKSYVRRWWNISYFVNHPPCATPSSCLHIRCL